MKSVKGMVMAQCPNGCEQFDAEVFSLVDAGQDPDLRELVSFGEMNLLACPECGAVFYHDTPFVYIDRARELIAMVLPDCPPEQQAARKLKMREDFNAMKEGLLREMKVDFEPLVLFGMETLKQVIDAESDLDDETAIIAAVAEEKGLLTAKIKPSAARARCIPALLPYSRRDGLTLASALDACKQIFGEHPGAAGLGRLAGELATKGAQLPPLL